MKLFSMYRRKRAGKSVTSRSTYDVTSLTSLRSLEDSLQVPKTDGDEEMQPVPDAPPVKVDVDNEESAAGDAQAGDASGQPIEKITTRTTTLKTTTSPSSVEDEEEEALAEKMRTKSQRDDTYEERERREKEEAMMSLWRKSALPKKLPIPTKYPSYLKEPPELSYEETASYIRRKMYNDSRIKMNQEEPPKQPAKRQKSFEPKSNKTVHLRSTYIRRDPIVSQYFSDHYNAYKKPPFRNTNVKFCN